MKCARSVVQAVSRWLPNPAARVKTAVSSYVIFGGQIDTRTGFVRVLRVSVPMYPPTVLQYNWPNGVHTSKWTELHSTTRNLKKRNFK